MILLQSYIFAMYKNRRNNNYEENLRNDYFTKLAGTEELRKQIEQGNTEKQIRASWEPALSNFKTMRLKYLLYQ